MDDHTSEPATGRSISESSDPEEFSAAIVAGREPRILRGAVANWAAVAAGRGGIEAAASYLLPRYTGAPVYTIVGQPDIDGAFGFDDSFAHLNYQARQTSLASVLEHLAGQAQAGGFAIAVQSAAVRAVLRDWDADNPMPFLPANVAPTLWINNRARVAPHSDIHDNVACVVAGTRRFTVMPPEQISNLYLAPLRGSPGGVPVSAVDLWNPDLAHYPAFANALAEASSATLQPGDALFIPALWWHAVASLDSFNMLVNYWWGGTASAGLSPYHALNHALLAIAALPREKRARWRSYFEHLVFRLGGEPGAHLPPGLSDPLTYPDEEQLRDALGELAQQLATAGAFRDRRS